MLIHEKEITVRFSEIDSLGILWHGHYVKYFEDGREAFGSKYDLDYLRVKEQNFVIPIVKIDCNFKQPIRYKDQVIVETKYINSPAAKIIFDYRLFDKNTGDTFATGQSVQVFLDDKNQLCLTLPEFYVEWKKRWGLET